MSQLDDTRIAAALGRAAGDGEGALDLAALTARAEADGLLDVAYAVEESPVGPLLIAATPKGLVKISFGNYEFDTVLEGLAASISPRVLEAPARLDPVRRELDEYFEGTRKKFGLALDWQLSRGFRRAALRELTAVGYGQTVSYRELAERTGRPRAARAVGTAMARNPIPLVVPCHRVIRADGTLGEYGGTPETKRFLLQLEAAL